MIQITKTRELKGHLAGIYALCLGEENFIFSAGVDKHVIRWDLNSPDNAMVIVKSPETVYSLFYHSNNNLLFIGTSTGKIHIIDLFQNKEIKLLQSHTGRIFNFKLFHSFLLGLGADGCLSFTNVNTLKTEHILKVSEERIRSIDIKNNIAAIACGDSHIRIVDLSKRTIVKSFIAHEKSCNVVKFHPDNTLLLSGGWDAHLKLWDQNYQLIKSIPAHNYAIYSVEFSPDKKLVATGSRDKSIKLWDALNIEFPTSITSDNLKGHQFSVNKLIWDERSGHLISASDDRKIMVWAIDAVS